MLKEKNSVASEPANYEKVVEERQCPEVGSELVPFAGDKCSVFKSKRKENGKYRTIYFCNAHFDEEKGWGLVNLTYGLKCIITRRDKKKIALGEKIGLYIKKLKVKKVSEDKSYVVCEVVE